MEASRSCPQLVLVCSLLLITTLISPAVFASPAHQGASSSAATPSRGGNITQYISYRAGSSSKNHTRLQPRRSPTGNPIAQLNASWVNSDGPGDGVAGFTYNDGSIVRPLLVRGKSGPSFACGFFCRGSCDATTFSIYLLVTNGSSAVSDSSSGFPQVAWSANRNSPVGEGARLRLTLDGQLVLSDSGGKMVWSTDTVGKGVAGVNLTEKGNLVLYSSTGETLWQSFDHATDTVLAGQSESVFGQLLVADASATNSSDGQFYLTVTEDSFSAFIHSGDRLEMYYSQLGTLFPSPFGRTVRTNPTDKFVRLERDGHLRLYVWSGDESSWKVEKDLLNGSCLYPTVCGNYGICTSSDNAWQRDCSCPTGSSKEGVNYFRPVDDRKLSQGCFPSATLSCESWKTHILVRQDDISYFGYVQRADHEDIDVEGCKRKCLGNCSCRAAFFKFGHDPSKGDCYLPSRILSLIENQNKVTGYNSSAFIKVQSVPQMLGSVPMIDGKTVQRGAGKRRRELGSILGASSFVLLLLGVVAGVVLWRRSRKGTDELEGCQLPHLPGMPVRFSYEELRSATGNFSSLLGEGGFGSVFMGTLADDARVAVKQLGGKGQGMKEFLAEVETIGSIHHVNLVRLVGYCAHKLHRLLVYEYMFNGSLDKWIFHRDDDNPRNLDWQTRHKIILHVAKGLAYLHEECRHRIAHLDIKPENILLDEGFNAKVSDFGLSKLIERDQSRVLTTMRGTPGYLAPEWLNSMITEKVDVYSFGVVALETVCGRRNIDRLKQNITLVNMARSAAEEDRLIDIVDRKCKGIDQYGDEAAKMVMIALWCLQEDPDRRPPMSAVVKVLEGAAVTEPFLDFSLSAPMQVMDCEQVSLSSSTSAVPSALSQPR